MRDEPKNDDLYASNSQDDVNQNNVETPEQQPQTEPAAETAATPASESFDSTEQTETEPNATVLPQPTDAAPVATETTPGVFASTPVATPEPTKKRKNLIKAAIIAGAVLLLGGIGGSAYAFWYQNPEKVVTDALVHAITAKTVSGTGVINVEGSDGYKGKIEISGRNSEAGNATVAVKFTINSDEVDTTVNGEGFFSKDGDIYVKLNDAQKLLDTIAEQAGVGVSLDAFDAVIKKIDGNWIKISKDDLKDAGEEVRTAQNCFAEVTKTLSNDASFRKTVMSETEKLYKENKFIVINKSLGSRDINGQGSLGYEIDADQAKADAFFTGFASTALGKKMKDCDSSIKFEEFADEVKEQSDSEGTVELWVSRFGHIMTEAKLTSKDDESTSSAVFNPVFNKNEEVTAPAESISISEVIKDFEKAYEDLMMSAYEDAYESAYMEGVNYN